MSFPRPFVFLEPTRHPTNQLTRLDRRLLLRRT